MTVRQQRRILQLALGLMFAAAVAQLLVMLLHRPGASRDYVAAIPPFLFLFVFLGQLRRLKALEIEHGPDYHEPATQSVGRTRFILVGALLIAAALAAVAALLVLR